MKHCTCLLSCCLLCGSLWAKTLRVGSGGAFTTVTSALAATQAGDTILVNGGYYEEGNLVIAQSIFFIGINRPVLDGSRKYEVLSIKADYVVVSGFRIQRSGYATLDDPGGIKVYDRQHVTIDNNEIYDNFFGIYLQYAKHCAIRNNHIVAFGTQEQEIGNGIHCWKSDSLQITGNSVEGHRDGIYFEFVTHSIIWRNVAQRNLRYGLHFMFSNNDAYILNVFKNNGAGVAVMFTKNVTMLNNKFDQNWGDAAYGLLLKEISDSHLKGNYFTRNTAGVFMEGANRIRIEQNVFEQNGWAFQIQASCMDNTIRNNNFIANSFDVSTNGSTVLNEFEDNYWDKYEGYDLDRDGRGDVPFRPLSLYSVIIEQTPMAMILYRSFMVSLLDRSEKIFPTITPDNFIDCKPRIKPLGL